MRNTEYAVCDNEECPWWGPKPRDYDSQFEILRCPVCYSAMHTKQKHEEREDKYKTFLQVEKIPQHLRRER